MFTKSLRLNWESIQRAHQQGFSGISWQTAPVAAPSHPRCPRPAFQPLFRFCLGREWSTVVHTWSTPLARRLTTADGPSTLHAKHNPATANAAHKSTCITVIDTPNTIAGKTATESVCRIKQNTNSQCCQFLSACLFPLSPIPMLLFYHFLITFLPYFFILDCKRNGTNLFSLQLHSSVSVIFFKTWHRNVSQSNYRFTQKHDHR